MNKILLMLLSLITLSAGAARACPPEGKPAPAVPAGMERVTVQGPDSCVITSLNVEIAATEAEQTHGLMDRKSLPDKYGMLFLFPDYSEKYFWMKDTLIPLDMLFIDEHGKIFNIHENARPNDLTTIPSHGPTKGVIEIIGGGAKLYGLKTGDIVKYKAFQ